MLAPLHTSPLHDAHNTPDPGAETAWIEVAGMPVPLRLADPAAEAAAADSLAMCDLSCLRRTVVKGPGAAAYLSSAGWPVPERVLELLSTSDGGLVARTGAGEFLLEGSPADSRVAEWENLTASPAPGAYQVRRQDAIIALVGARAVDALRQLSAYEFRTDRPDGQVVTTRLGGVSCTVLMRTLNGHRVFQLSVEGTYGAYLWHLVAAVVRELDGKAIGLSTLYPQLAARHASTNLGEQP